MRSDRGGVVIGSVAWGLTWAGAVAVCANTASNPVTVQSQRFDVHYNVSPTSAPLTSVELWYTADRGKTWHRFGDDTDRRSPVQFLAPREGLLGLFIVLRNRFGASSESPTSETRPQQWVFVDYTPPVLQIQEVRVARTAAGERTVQLRWSAWDTHLPARPIDVSYRVAEETTWTPIARRLANLGRYDWVVPAAVTGPVWIRLSVRDRGGHETRLTRGPLAVGAPKAAGDVDPVAPVSAKAATPGPSPSAVLDPQTIREADTLFKLGSFYLLRGNLDVASERFREALQLNPTHTGAQNDLAGVLYRKGTFAEAIDAYQRLLADRPRHSGALEGLALAHAGRHEYRAARERLEELLKIDSSNARTWLNLGDMVLMAGEPMAARSYWSKALTVDSRNTDAIRSATVRLQAPAATWASRSSSTTTGGVAPGK